MAWDLEAGELALAVLCEVVLGDFMAWLGDHAGVGDLAQTRVGHADDLDLLARSDGDPVAGSITLKSMPGRG